ncbi:hypothetical protein M2426_004173 [Pseudomonas moraviensis]|uniref:hypothetical protein n=1 Tax=Pseudomonas moraviensis TaxID=321662 RepID=UPI003D1EF012
MTELSLEIRTASKRDIPSIVNQATELDLLSLINSGSREILDALLQGLDHQSLGRLFAIINTSTLQQVLLGASESAIANLVEIIQPKQLSKLLSNASDELIGKLVDSAGSKKSRLSIASALPNDRRKQWSEYIQSQEKLILQLKQSTNDSSQSLLDEKRRLLSDLEAAIRDKEDMLRGFDDEARIKREHFESMSTEAKNRLVDLQNHIAKQEDEIKIRELELAKRIKEFERATSKQVQQRIELKVPEYVAAAVNVLETREAHYRKKAMHWSIHGSVVLALAIAGTIGISLYGYVYGEKLSNLAWQSLLFVSFKGLVVLGVLGLWAKHAFTVSNAYMHEAIKRADRAHAINFGKLYLEIYGNSVDRKELIDIFENWNIATESAFSKITTDGFEPKVLDKLVEVLKLTDRNK